MKRGLALALCTVGAPALAEETARQFPEDYAWAWVTPAQTSFYVVPGEIKYGAGGSGSVDAWVHGRHERDATVKYRMSMWLFRFDCAGGYQTLAVSQYGADGRAVYSWDGVSPYNRVRPGSMFSSLEAAVCPHR